MIVCPRFVRGIWPRSAALGGWDRERTAQSAGLRSAPSVWGETTIASMAMGMVAAPQCAVCGSPATWVAIVAPGRVPAEWEQWKAERRQAFEEHRDPGRWCLLFEGVAAGNGRVEETRANRSRPPSTSHTHTCRFIQRGYMTMRASASAVRRRVLLPALACLWI